MTVGGSRVLYIEYEPILLEHFAQTFTTYKYVSYKDIFNHYQTSIIIIITIIIISKSSSIIIIIIIIIITITIIIIIIIFICIALLSMVTNRCQLLLGQSL